MERLDNARILIYSHDSFGLGHLRRCRAIAHAIVDRYKGVSVLILSGSPIIGSFDFLPRVDFVRIPGVIKLTSGEYQSLGLHIDLDQTMAIRAAIIQQTAESFRPDLLLVDTAGRLQNRDDLMAELAKIVRVIAKRDSDAPHNTLLVLDATTGQNAVAQVEIFRRIADVTGLVMTKLDGTAKGGVLVALADRFGLPIHAIGVGESIDDLAPFDPQEFARALTGL